MVDGFSKTPRYVLRDGSHPISPDVSPAAPENHAIVIFGFSDKPEYDVFSVASSLALAPYPLVKGFLQNQIGLEVDQLKLVVLDATSPEQSCFYAATFESVLKSFQQDLETVMVSHRLIRDEISSDYRIEASSFHNFSGAKS